MICVSISRKVDCLVSNAFRDVVLQTKAAFGKMRIGHAWLKLFVPIHKLKFGVYHEARQSSQLFSPDRFRCFW